MSITRRDSDVMSWIDDQKQPTHPAPTPEEWAAALEWVDGRVDASDPRCGCKAHEVLHRMTCVYWPLAVDADV